MGQVRVGLALCIGAVCLVTVGCGEDPSVNASSVASADEVEEEVWVEESDSTLFMPLASEGDVVAWVDLGRYVGEWYEIATTPSQQQSFCSGTRAIYEAGDAGRINVTNQCYQGSLDGRMQEVEGYAEVVDATTNAKLVVNFFGFGAPYWVIALDGRESEEPYAWSVVSGPNDNSLWLLSRTPQLSEDVRESIEAHLAERGIDTSRWLETEQPSQPE